ncbi:protease modulator HflC [Zavarzinia compransoris]|uniref:protease modulator HflC n=1 Tax=Zavarzinia marina TaxID=2911065 RepID=UPI001F17175D|nr:protease modulator HflC [Zavarzinia marina]MCF4166435.1 protease modulator HflC [Zavarzinia marina]
MNRLVIAGVVVVAILVVALSSVFTVSMTQQAMVLQFGEPKKMVADPGLHFKIPFFQNVVYIDKRVLVVDAPAEELIAADQKRVVIDSFARWRIVDPLKYYQRLRNEDNARRQLATFISSTLRDVVGREPLTALLIDPRAESHGGLRAEIMRNISQLVDAKAKENGVEIVDVRIRRADLPEANSQAIFQRMRTEREQEAKLIRATGQEAAQKRRAEADREATVIIANAKRDSEIKRGEGDAQAIKIFADAFGKDPAFFAFYRSMQAYREALSDRTTTMVLSPNSDFFRYLDNVAGAISGVPASR